MRDETGSSSGAPAVGDEMPRTLEESLARIAGLERERRVAEALLQIESLDLREVLDRICSLTVELMPCDRATVYLYSNRIRGFVPAADLGTPPHVFQRFVDRVFFGRSRARGRRAVVPFREELIAGRLGYATLDDASPDLRALLEEVEQYAMCLAALRSSERGSIFVTVGKPPGFDETAFRIIQTVARQAANLVDHARTFQKLEHSATARAGLAALATGMNLETEPAGVAGLVCREAATLFRLPVVALLVRDGADLVVLGAHGISADGLRLPLGDDTPMLVQAYRNGTAAFRNDLAESPIAAGPLCRVLGLKSVLVMPLVGRRGPMGCLLLGHTERRHGFSQQLLDETLMLGPLTSSALDRASLFHLLERSEEHFRSLIEHASDLITVCAPDGSFRYQSPSVWRLLGYRPDELVGRPLDALVHPDDLGALRRALEASLADGSSGAPLETRFRHIDGSWRVLEGVSTPLIGSDGAPVIVINSRDATERKRAEARDAGRRQVLELLAHGSRLETVLGALADVVDADLAGVTTALFVLEGHGTLRLCAAPRLAAGLRAALTVVPLGDEGGCAGAAATRRRRVVVAGDRIDSAWTHDLAAAAGLGGCCAEPILSPTKDVLGVLVTYRTDAPPLDEAEIETLEAGAQLAAIAIQRTMSDLELATARDQALAASRLKSEFLANMSHEIRTPMNGVIGMTDLLAESRLDAEQRDFVSTIRTSADALLTVINDILDFSKIEAGKMTIERADFNLRTTLEEVVDLLAPRAASKGIELACAVPPALPEHVFGDPHRLRQVLTNLVGNAVKFTEMGWVSLEAALLTETATHARIRLSVRDTGIGIPKERQGLVFESFTQADGSMSRRYGGTGLGLAISRQLVELMDGEIGLESAPGEGSVFWTEFVFEKQTAPARCEPALPAALGGLRVLVVDDHEVNRRICCEWLRAWGCVADQAASGAAALEALGRTPYGLVLLDMHMPEMDGEATAAAIRAEPRLAGLPLVLFSSISSRQGPAGASRDHFAAALTKPVRPAHLLAVVSEVARGVRGATPSDARAPDDRRQLGLRVLLAEDNTVNRHVAIHMLGRLGCEVTAVEDGTQVLAALQAEVYDVVLMDVQMPVMDGLETTVNVRRAEADTGRHVPIIAMTAHAREGDRERCLAVGMDGYVAKPVRTAELRAALTPYARRGEPAGHGDGAGTSRSIVSTTSSSPSSSPPASTRRTTPSRSTT